MTLDEQVSILRAALHEIIGLDLAAPGEHTEAREIAQTALVRCSGLALVKPAPRAPLSPVVMGALQHFHDALQDGL